MLHKNITVKVPLAKINVRRYSTSSNPLSAPTMVMKTPVGNTALWVAHCRGTEYHRSDAIAKDQFAEMLSGEEGKAIYEHYTKFLKKSGRGNPKFEQSIEEEFHDSIVCRCRYYDDMVLSKSAQNCKQVVILASGLDSRAFRLNWSPNVSVFELDRKEVLDFKLNKLKQINASPTCHKHIPIDADLVDESWPQKMKDQGFNTQAPSIWLVEGLIMYIAEPGVRKLLQTCSKMSAEGSFIGGDVGYVPSILLKQLPLYEEAKRLGNPFLFHTRYPEKLYQECGWPNVKVNQKGDADMKYTRSKRGVVPRWVPFFPRNFFVQASK